MLSVIPSFSPASWQHAARPTHGRISMLPHLIPSQDIIDLFTYKSSPRCHLVLVSSSSAWSEFGYMAYLFGDWKLIGAGGTCPFVVACFRGYNKDVCATWTKEHFCREQLEVEPRRLLKFGHCHWQYLILSLRVIDPRIENENRVF